MEPTSIQRTVDPAPVVCKAQEHTGHSVMSSKDEYFPRQVTLAETHVVHTKIYPKYKSRRAIEFARDDFSKWLEPNESPMTDVILLGHSMGGLLSAEVVLLPPFPRHRIIGTINLDTPFLGMHPGVIKSGLGSIFRPAPNVPSKVPAVDNQITSPGLSPTQSLARTDSNMTSMGMALTPSASDPLFSPQPMDPNYNAAFPNDVRLPVRKGWNSALHFIVKHSDGLTKATKQYVTSHVEFGGAMADYSGLKARYTKIRALEVEDEAVRRSVIDAPHPPRRRFVNYYTASSGMPKRPKSPAPTLSEQHESGSTELLATRTQGTTLSATNSRASSRSPRISVEEHRDDTIIPQELQEPQALVESDFEMNHLDPAPLSDHGSLSDVDVFINASEEPATIIGSALSTTSVQREPSPDARGSSLPKDSPAFDVTHAPALEKTSSLPPIPDVPPSPPSPDLTTYTDKDARKLAAKEHKRALKAHQTLINDHAKALRDRARLEEKRAKATQKEQDKRAKQAERGQRDRHKEAARRKATMNPEIEIREQRRVMSDLSHASDKDDDSHTPSNSSTSAQPEKKKRDKKFCMLPPKDAAGNRDPTWIRVFMEGVDEVGAHCGLFFVSETYERLMGDVGARIEEWIREDMSVRAVEEAAGE
ncbi:hypothetical protein B0A49_04614 [Cryomyces minteri]|uniref:Uncharacterized protein n=2 Tax=Cryomyces minteri TaxID=331657 RepID=A0A4V6WKZ1_9PEZI|nr:hypothetical protein B0A49_04614 [Cryomyces minteri]